MTVNIEASQGSIESQVPGEGGGWSGQHPHLFRLSSWTPDQFEGGTLRGAHDGNWPILKGAKGAVYLARLEPGGVREPHWHPSAWEVNYVVSGKVRWSFAGPDGTYDQFEAQSGDVVFAPQGHFHYFENASTTEDLIVLIVFNASTAEPNNDIGIVSSLSMIPVDVLAACFKCPVEMFEKIPKSRERVVITKKNKG